MDAAEEAALQIDAWKTIVEVQQHFNDVQMRIRSICLTLLGTIGGAFAYAYHQATWFGTFSQPLSTYLALIALVIVLLFWFMDGVWYHQFLLGAVIAGQKLEQDIQKTIPAVALTSTISRESAKPFFGRMLSPGSRGTIFYGALALLTYAGAILSRDRNPFIVGGVVLLSILLVALLYASLPPVSAFPKAACSCGSITFSDFCASCGRQTGFTSPSNVLRSLFLWSATALFLFISCSALATPFISVHHEVDAERLTIERLNWDLARVSAELQTRSLASLHTTEGHGTIYFDFIVQEHQWQYLPQGIRALLQAPGGWFEEDTKLSWLRFHSGRLCSLSGETHISVQIRTENGRSLQRRDFDVTHC